MITEEELNQPVTVRDVAQFMASVLIQIAGVLRPDEAEYEEALEDIATGLNEISNEPRLGLADSLLQATSMVLMETEIPARKPSA